MIYLFDRTVERARKKKVIRFDCVRINLFDYRKKGFFKGPSRIDGFCTFFVFLIWAIRI